VTTDTDRSEVVVLSSRKESRFPGLLVDNVWPQVSETGNFLDRWFNMSR